MHKLRLKHDAIIVGLNTYKEDKPKLNCRLNGINKIKPFILINDFATKTKFPKITLNVKNFDNFYSIMNKHNIRSVLVEGGLQTFNNFLKRRVFDEIVICQSSEIIKNQKRYKLDKKLIKSSCKKIDSQEYFMDKIEIYKMFSGIIQAYGKISKFSKSKDFLSIEIQSNLKGYNIGSSICCSGICLTVTSFLKINSQIFLKKL